MNSQAATVIMSRSFLLSSIQILSPSSLLVMYMFQFKLMKSFS
ncbi:unnamed protein product, partial [Bemisia tabaci]